MSTVKADNISNVAGTKTITADRVASATARAWANFVGSGTVSVRASYGVSSVTDNGVGDYTINWSPAMPDTYYAPVLGWDSGSYNQAGGYSYASYQLTGSYRIYVTSGTSGATDPDMVSCAVFR